MTREVDEYGQVMLYSEDLLTLLYRGKDISQFPMESDDIIVEYNKWCVDFDLPEHVIPEIVPHTKTPSEEHAERASNWDIAPEYKSLNVREFVLAKCKSENEMNRVNLEMDMFEERGLVEMLKMVITLVDHWRQHNVVWGVGRGSSVASYVLFKIGIHKIDSLLYDLDIVEFLKSA